MKHAVGLERARHAAQWAGIDLDAPQERLLVRYAEWLGDEAIAAGGLGPREGNRLWTRHIADSVTFACGWSGSVPEEILDVGTGVGLPGIPLAICWPQCRVTLLDRGGRRIRLLHRAVRLLGLSNVVIAQADVYAVADVWQGMVFRGSVPAPEAVGLTSRLLADDGTAVLGLSRRAELTPPAADLSRLAEALGLAAETVAGPEEALDGPAWLLIMRRRGADQLP